MSVIQWFFNLIVLLNNLHTCKKKTFWTHFWACIADEYASTQNTIFHLTAQHKSKCVEQHVKTNGSELCLSLVLRWDTRLVCVHFLSVQDK